MGKAQEMRQELLRLKDKMQAALNADNLEEARQCDKEITDLKKALELQEKLDKEEEEEALEKARLKMGVGLKGGSNLLSGKFDLIAKNESFEKKTSRYDENNHNLSLSKYLNGALRGNWSSAGSERGEFQALSTGTGTVLIPSILSGKIIDMARDQMVLNGIPIIPMETNNLIIAKIIKDPEFGFKLEGEDAAVSDISFGAVKLQTKTAYGLIQITEEMFQSANCESVIKQAMSQALAQILDKAGLYGLGTERDANDKLTRNEPKGITTYSDINVLENQSLVEASKYTSFIQAIGTITVANKRPTAAAYNSKIETSLNLLTNTNGDPLQEPKVMGTLNRISSNHVEDNTALVFDENAVVMGIQKNIAIDSAKILTNGTIMIRVMAFVDYAVLDQKAITLIKYASK